MAHLDTISAVPIAYDASRFAFMQGATSQASPSLSACVRAFTTAAHAGVGDQEFQTKEELLRRLAACGAAGYLTMGGGPHSPPESALLGASAYAGTEEKLTAAHFDQAAVEWHRVHDLRLPRVDPDPLVHRALQIVSPAFYSTKIIEAPSKLFKVKRTLVGRYTFGASTSSIPSNPLTVLGLSGSLGDTTRRMQDLAKQEVAPQKNGDGKKTPLASLVALARQVGLDPGLLRAGPDGWRPATSAPGAPLPPTTPYIARHQVQVGGMDVHALRAVAVYMPSAFDEAKSIVSSHVVTNGLLSGGLARFAKTGVHAPVPVPVPVNLGRVGERDWRAQLEEMIAVGLPGDMVPEHPITDIRYSTLPYRTRPVTGLPFNSEYAESQTHHYWGCALSGALVAAADQTAEILLASGATYPLHASSSTGQPARLPGSALDISPREEREAFHMATYSGFTKFVLSSLASQRKDGINATDAAKAAMEAVTRGLAHAKATLPAIAMGELKQKYDITKGRFVSTPDGAGATLELAKLPRTYVVDPLMQRFVGHAATLAYKSHLVSADPERLDDLTAEEVGLMSLWGPTPTGGGHPSRLLSTLEAYSTALLTGDTSFASNDRRIEWDEQMRAYELDRAAGKVDENDYYNPDLPYGEPPADNREVFGDLGDTHHAFSRTHILRFRPCSLDAPPRVRHDYDHLPASSHTKAFDSVAVVSVVTIGDDCLSVVFEWDHCPPSYDGGRSGKKSTLEGRFAAFKEAFAGHRDAVERNGVWTPGHHSNVDEYAYALEYARYRPDRMWVVGEDASQYDSTQPPMGAAYDGHVRGALSQTVPEVIARRALEKKGSVEAAQAMGVAAGLITHSLTRLTTPSEVLIPAGPNPPTLLYSGTKSGGQGLTEHNSVLSTGLAYGRWHLVAKACSQGLEAAFGSGYRALHARALEDYVSQATDHMNVGSDHWFRGEVPVALIIRMAELWQEDVTGMCFTVDGMGVVFPPSRLNDGPHDQAQHTCATAELSPPLADGLAFAGCDLRVARYGGKLRYVLTLARKRVLRALLMDKGGSRGSDAAGGAGVIPPNVLRALKATSLYALGGVALPGFEHVVAELRRSVPNIASYQKAAEMELDDGLVHPAALALSHVPMPDTVVGYLAGACTLGGEPDAADARSAALATILSVGPLVVNDPLSPLKGKQITDALEVLSVGEGSLLPPFTPSAVRGNDAAAEILVHATNLHKLLRMKGQLLKGSKVCPEPDISAAQLTVHALGPAVTCYTSAFTLRVQEILLDYEPRSLAVRVHVSRLKAAYDEKASAFDITQYLVGGPEPEAPGEAPRKEKVPKPSPMSQAEIAAVYEAAISGQRPAPPPSAAKAPKLTMEVKTATKVVGRVGVPMVVSNTGTVLRERYHAPVVSSWLRHARSWAPAGGGGGGFVKGDVVEASPLASAAVSHALIFGHDGGLLPEELWERLGFYRPLTHPPANGHDLVDAFSFKAMYMRVVGGRTVMAPCSYTGPDRPLYESVLDAANAFVSANKTLAVDVVPLPPARIGALTPAQLEAAQAAQRKRQAAEKRPVDAAAVSERLAAFRLPRGGGRGGASSKGKGFRGRTHKHAKGDAPERDA